MNQLEADRRYASGWEPPAVLILVGLALVGLVIGIGVKFDRLERLHCHELEIVGCEGEATP